ncbi:MAG: endonuclease III, partial [Dysgonamonadaceae bacterium]
FGGEVPADIDSLLTIPGVGRKTANVMLAVAFDVPAMPVDTHVFRVSNRLGLTDNAKTPLEVEKELVKHIPKELLSKAHHWLILHGRYVCTARNPKCEECGLRDDCKYYEYKVNCNLTRL